MYDKAKDYVRIIEKYDSISSQIKFCQAFIRTFNEYEQVASIVATGKLNLIDNKREKAVGYAKSVVKDVVGFFQVPTNILGRLADDVTSAAFQGYRAKGYKQLANQSIHMTLVELLSQTLAYALLVYYEDNVYLSEQEASRRGEKTAHRLIEKLKDTKKNRLKIASTDTLVSRVEKMLKRIIQFDYIEPQRSANSNGKAINLDTDNIQTLIALSAATLLGLRLDCFVELELQQQTMSLLEKMVSYHDERLTALERAGGTHVKGDFTLTYTHLQGVKYTYSEEATDKEVKRGAEIVKNLNQQPLNPDLIKYGLVKPLPPKEELAELLNPFKANMTVDGKMAFNIENYVWGSVTIVPRLESKAEKVNTDTPEEGGVPHANPM